MIHIRHRYRKIIPRKKKKNLESAAPVFGNRKSFWILGAHKRRIVVWWRLGGRQSERGTVFINVCSRSSDPFYIVPTSIKWITSRAYCTSWTHSKCVTLQNGSLLLGHTVYNSYLLQKSYLVTFNNLLSTIRIARKIQYVQEVATHSIQ